MANIRRLVELGMPPELAKEVAAQIDAGGGSVAWDDVSGKPSTFPASPASVEAAVAAKTEIAALDSESTTAEVVAALQA